jgi:hypothetical protein
VGVPRSGPYSGAKICRPQAARQGAVTQKFLGTALAWAVLSVWSPSALGQSGADQPPAEQPSTPTAMTTPSMTGPLAANPNPTSVDAGFLGPVYVTGAVSGRGLWQNNKFPDQQHAQASLSNGQVFLQKTEGLFQYYLDIGAYTIPTLGAPYFSTSTTVGDFYGSGPGGMGENRTDRQFLHSGWQAAGCRR